MSRLMNVSMRIKDTLPATERYDILANASSGGVFTTMFKGDEPWSADTANLCVGYYFVRSGNKLASPIYHTMVDLLSEKDPSLTDEELLKLVNTTIGSRIIRPKYIDKWTRVYKALVTSTYDPLDDYSETETHKGTNTDKTTYDITGKKSGDDTDTTTYDLSEGKSGTNSDVTTHDVTTEENGKTGTSETTTRANEQSNDVYGFNSTSPVGDTYNNENTTETVIGDAEKNTTQNIKTKTGTESKAIGIDETTTKKGTETKTLGVDETNTKTGTENKEFGIDETRTKNGRHTNGASLVNAELDMRSRQIFFDIVYRDIDSIIALSIY